MSITKAHEVEEAGWIDTGVPQINLLLGDGIPRGVITEISGRFSCGKSTLAMQIVAAAQKEGVECLWYDAEQRFKPDYAESLGVDTKKLSFIRTHTAEEGLNDIIEFLYKVDSKGKVKHKADRALIIIDAVGALHPRWEAEGDMESVTIGSQSKLVAKFCRSVVPLLSMTKSALIALNHEFEDIGKAMPGRPAPIKTSGGAKLGYHKSIWMRIVRMKDFARDNVIGFTAALHIKKNSEAPTENQKIEVEFIRGEGFVPKDVLFERAVDAGVITKDGMTYYFGEEKIAVGEGKARNELQNNQELRAKIEAEV